MGGYAPFSYLVNVPGSDGGTFVLQPDTGARFPEPPFTYLVWPVQEEALLDGPERNAEQGTVTGVYHDSLTVERPDDALDLRSGIQVAALSTQPVYDPGVTITLSDVFPSDDTGVHVSIRDPSGYIQTVRSLDVAADAGGSAYSVSTAPSVSGQWSYVFASDQRSHREQDFFVRFSSVL